MNDKVYNKLIELCVDICKRNGKTKLLWFADKDKTLNYCPAKDEMIITVHRWFANKSCPGNWLYSRLGHLASEVTKRLGTATPTPAPTITDGKYYRIRKSWTDSASQLGAYINLENAKKACEDGYTVYDWNGKAVYPVKAEATSKPRVTVLEWQKAAIADGFKFHKYGADGMWGGECESVAERALVMKRDTYKYQNLTKIVQRIVGVNADGLCGQLTHDAIVKYQKANGLGVDGCVGINTWKVILGV
jgi:peptidoglycan hydrolase-like protein with peptidoglycan-binding domain